MTANCFHEICSCVSSVSRGTEGAMQSSLSTLSSRCSCHMRPSCLGLIAKHKIECAHNTPVHGSKGHNYQLADVAKELDSA